MSKLGVMLNELDILRYAFDNSEEEICICTIDGGIIYANNQVKKNHQFEDSLFNHFVFDLNVSEITRDKWRKILAELKENSGTIKKKVTKKLKSGKVVHYELKIQVEQMDNNISHIWFFAKDITHMVFQESKIKELNYLMDAILNNIPVYVFVKDPANDFRYIYWNKAFEKFSKISSDKALGKTDAEIFPSKADAKKFRKDDLTILHQGGIIEFQEEYVNAEGTIQTVNTLKTLVPSDKILPWIIGVSWDITELKETERKLIEARNHALEANRVKSAFLANMSHEIRTPLNAIVGFAKLIGEADSQEEIEQYSEIIDNNADLLLQLINDILDISKIEANTLEFNNNQVNLNDLCQEILEVHKLKVRPEIELIYERPTLEQVLFCDRNRLSQVIINLLTNALKFTPKGEIRFGFTPEEHQILFFVKDTGMGISKEKINDIFGRFTKLNSFIQGSGLGLSICQTIIDKMGGNIWVESEENVGSQFYFTIPYSGGCFNPIIQIDSTI